MTGPQLEFQLCPEDAEAFSAFLKETWQTAPTTPPARRGDFKSNPLQLLLTIIIAINAGVLLADRFKLTARLKKTIDWARQRKAQNPKRNITVKLPDGRYVFLVDVDPAEVLDIRRNESP